MAEAPERVTTQSDFLLPDWSAMDAGDVWLAAQQNVPEAITELAKREAAFAAGAPTPKRPTPARLRNALARRTRR